MTSTIAQLLAKAHTYRDDLGPRPYQNARKALIRIAQAAGRHPTDVTCDDVLAAHPERAGQVPAAMRQIAERSGGQTLFPDELDRLDDAVRSASTIPSTSRSARSSRTSSSPGRRTTASRVTR